MTIRLIAIAAIGFMLMGYAPRWLTTSREAWVVWVAAAAIVYGGPWLLRRMTSKVFGRVRSIRNPLTGQRST